MNLISSMSPTMRRIVLTGLAVLAFGTPVATTLIASFSGNQVKEASLSQDFASESQHRQIVDYEKLSVKSAESEATVSSVFLVKPKSSAPKSYVVLTSANGVEEKAVKDFIHGSVLQTLIGSDSEARPHPLGRLVDGCSGTFVRWDGKLYYVTALHCMSPMKNVYLIELYLDGARVQTVQGRRVRGLSRFHDIVMLEVDERQFAGTKLPRTLELADSSPQAGDIVVMAGANAGIQGWPGSRNHALRVVKVGRSVGQYRYVTLDAAWYGHSGGPVVRDGKLLGVVSTATADGNSTFISVEALGLAKGSAPRANADSKAQLTLISIPGCKACTVLKDALKQLGYEFDEIDASKSRVPFRRFPGLIASNGSAFEAPIPGASLTDWLNKNGIQPTNPNGCGPDGCTPNPAEPENGDTGSKEANSWWFVVLVMMNLVVLTGYGIAGYWVYKKR